MKKLSLIFISALFLIATFHFALAFDSPQLGVCRIGDINGDCIVTSTDYSASKNCLMFRAVNVEGNYFCSEIFDMNGDGIESIYDYWIIKDIALGKRVNIEGCPEIIQIEQAPLSLDINDTSTISASVLSNHSIKRAAVGIEFKTDNASVIVLTGLEPLNYPYNQTITSDYVYNITDSIYYSNGMTSVGVNALAVGTSNITLKVQGDRTKNCPDINTSFQINVLCPDKDNDGFPDSSCGGLDCNDNLTEINSNATEACGNGIDENCDGSDVNCPEPEESNSGHSKKRKRSAEVINITESILNSTMNKTISNVSKKIEPLKEMITSKEIAKETPIIPDETPELTLAEPIQEKVGSVWIWIWILVVVALAVISIFALILFSGGFSNAGN